MYGWVHGHQLGWIKIQASQMEHDCVRKTLFIAKPFGAYLNRSDLAVDTFRRTIDHAHNDRVKNAPQVTSAHLAHLAHLDHRLQTATLRPEQPQFPSFYSLCPIGVFHIAMWLFP